MTGKRAVLNNLGVAIPGLLVIYVHETPTTNLINNRTLGGSWHMQTVGKASWSAACQMLVRGRDAWRALQTAYATGALITLQDNEFAYTGYIGSNPSFNVIRRDYPDSRRYETQFTFYILGKVPL